MKVPCPDVVRQRCAKGCRRAVTTGPVHPHQATCVTPAPGPKGPKRCKCRPQSWDQGRKTGRGRLQPPLLCTPTASTSHTAPTGDSRRHPPTRTPRPAPTLFIIYRVQTVSSGKGSAVQETSYAGGGRGGCSGRALVGSAAGAATAFGVGIGVVRSAAAAALARAKSCWQFSSDCNVFSVMVAEAQPEVLKYMMMNNVSTLTLPHSTL